MICHEFQQNSLTCFCGQRFWFKKSIGYHRLHQSWYDERLWFEMVDSHLGTQSSRNTCKGRNRIEHHGTTSWDLLSNPCETWRISTKIPHPSIPDWNIASAGSSRKRRFNSIFWSLVNTWCHRSSGLETCCLVGIRIGIGTLGCIQVPQTSPLKLKNKRQLSSHFEPAREEGPDEGVWDACKSQTKNRNNGGATLRCSWHDPSGHWPSDNLVGWCAHKVNCSVSPLISQRQDPRHLLSVGTGLERLHCFGCESFLTRLSYMFPRRRNKSNNTALIGISGDEVKPKSKHWWNCVGTCMARPLWILTLIEIFSRLMYTQAHNKCLDRPRASTNCSPNSSWSVALSTAFFLMHPAGRLHRLILGSLAAMAWSERPVCYNGEPNKNSPSTGLRIARRMPSQHACVCPTCHTVNIAFCVRIRIDWPRPQSWYGRGLFFQGCFVISGCWRKSGVKMARRARRELDTTAWSRPRRPVHSSCPWSSRWASTRASRAPTSSQLAFFQTCSKRFQ